MWKVAGQARLRAWSGLVPEQPLEPSPEPVLVWARPRQDSLARMLQPDSPAHMCELGRARERRRETVVVMLCWGKGVYGYGISQSLAVQSKAIRTLIMLGNRNYLCSKVVNASKSTLITRYSHRLLFVIVFELGFPAMSLRGSILTCRSTVILF